MRDSTNPFISPLPLGHFECFELLINSSGKEVQLITLFLHLSWAVFGVFGCVGKLLITFFMMNLELVNVAIIG